MSAIKKARRPKRKLRKIVITYSVTEERWQELEDTRLSWKAESVESFMKGLIQDKLGIVEQF